MGRLSYDPTIHPSTHPHPLYLSSQQHTHTHTTTPALSCAACTLPISSWVYSCTPCNFHLHVPCSNLPPLIHHPSHRLHSLSLLPSPAYPEGYFNCDACHRTGSGFSYHCTDCQLDLHTACASLPLSVNHHQSHGHPLTMAFCPPYENKGFSCDVCGTLGGNHWLYRCAFCEFDVHLGCGSTTTMISAGAAVPRSVMGYRVGSRGGRLIMGQVMSGLVEGAAEQLGQSLVAGFIVGGGGSNSDGGDPGAGSILNTVGAIFGNNN